MKNCLLLLFFLPGPILAQTLFIGSNATVHVQRGNGSIPVLYIDGDFQDNGIIEDDGSIETNGDANLVGILDFMIGGTGEGTDYNPVLAGGTAALTGGTLNISLTDGFMPNLGDQFTVLDAGNLDGIFTNLNLPTLASPNYWLVNYQPSLGLLKLEVSTILPIELLDFQAVAKGEHNRLKWTTVSEINADRFEVEHSSDGVFFAKIGTVKAVGGVATQQSYDFLHLRPSIGTNYYRLRQLDLDGSWERSKIVTVARDENGWSDVIAYPNPTSDMLYLELPGPGDGYSIEVLDINGRQVLVESNTRTLHLGHLLPGVYHLRITYSISGKTATEKFSIVR